MESIKAEYEKWRETGHDITYEQWLEIALEVERRNHMWMIEQWKKWQQNQELTNHHLKREADLQSGYAAFCRSCAASGEQPHGFEEYVKRIKEAKVKHE